MGHIMAELILRDADGVEVGRREMVAQERFDLYERCRERECLDHNGKRFRLITVAWDRVAEQCLCLVECQGYVPVDYCDC